MTGSYWKQRLSDVIAEATKQLEYAELRSNQALVVKHFLEEKDIFVSLPTYGIWKHSSSFNTAEYA